MKTFGEIYNEWHHLSKVDLARKVYEEQQKIINDMQKEKDEHIERMNNIFNRGKK